MLDHERRKSIEEWVTEVSGDVIETHPLSAMRCMHIQGGAPVTEVHGMTVAQGKEWKPKDAARIFQNKIQQYGQGLAGVQVYQFQAFYGTSTEPKNIMHYDKAGVLSFSGGLTEEPDERGMRSQGMRLTEGIVQRTFGMVGMIFQEMREDRRDMRSELRELREESRDAHRIILDLLRDKENRDDERMMRRLKFERESFERQKLMTFLPAILNRIFGNTVIPQDMADAAIFETAAMHLKTLPDEKRQEAMQSLAKALPPEAMGVVMTRLLEAGKTGEQKAEGKNLLKQAKREDAQKEEDDLLDLIPSLEEDGRH